MTSAFHMPRTEAIFNDCFRLASKSLGGVGDSFELTFHSAPDDLPEGVLQSRQMKELQSREVKAKLFILPLDLEPTLLLNRVHCLNPPCAYHNISIVLSEKMSQSLVGTHHSRLPILLCDKLGSTLRQMIMQSLFAGLGEDKQNASFLARLPSVAVCNTHVL